MKTVGNKSKLLKCESLYQKGCYIRGFFYYGMSTLYLRCTQIHAGIHRVLFIGCIYLLHFDYFSYIDSFVVC